MTLRGVSEGSKDVPGDRNRQEDGEAAEEMELLQAGGSRAPATCCQQRAEDDSNRKDNADQPFGQHIQRTRHRKPTAPQPGMVGMGRTPALNPAFLRPPKAVHGVLHPIFRPPRALPRKQTGTDS